MNLLERLSLSHSRDYEKMLLQDRDINVQRLSKKTVSKKRRLSDTSTETDRPSKTKRALKDEVLENTVMLDNPIIFRLKQMDRNRVEAMTTDVHPVLKDAKEEIMKLNIILRKVKEQSRFWRRKTLELQNELRSNKNITAQLSEQVVMLELGQEQLQNEVFIAEEKISMVFDTMRNLRVENNELKGTIRQMFVDLETFTKEDAKLDDISVADDATDYIGLNKLLVGTMTELHVRLKEIEDLKKLLASVTVEKRMYENGLKKSQINSEMEIKDNNAEEINSNMKIQKLQAAMDKCTLRVGVLTQNNDEIKKLKGDIALSPELDAKIIDILDVSEKLSYLENVCMMSYRKLLKEANDYVNGESV